MLLGKGNGGGGCFAAISTLLFLLKLVYYVLSKNGDFFPQDFEIPLTICILSCFVFLKSIPLNLLYVFDPFVLGLISSCLVDKSKYAAHDLSGTWGE